MIPQIDPLKFIDSQHLGNSGRELPSAVMINAICSLADGSGQNPPRNGMAFTYGRDHYIKPL
jgi:hypothetical protein